MGVKFDLPVDIEEFLRRGVGDLDQVAKEAALVELYRQQRLTSHQLAKALGLSRLEADAVLKRHAVTEDLLTDEELQRQVDEIRRSTDP